MRAVPAISARWAAIGPPESARQRPRKGQCRRDFGGIGADSQVWGAPFLCYFCGWLEV